LRPSAGGGPGRQPGVES
jgi:hypothetical protein